MIYIFGYNRPHSEQLEFLSPNFEFLNNEISTPIERHKRIFFKFLKSDKTRILSLQTLQNVKKKEFFEKLKEQQNNAVF